MLTADQHHHLSAAEPNPWALVVAECPAWRTAPGKLDSEALSALGEEMRDAKSVALLRVILFGRELRHQTEVNRGRLPGISRRLADLCRAFGRTPRHGRYARNIWDFVAANDGIIPAEWYGLGSGSVHDIVKGRTPRHSTKPTQASPESTSNAETATRAETSMTLDALLDVVVDVVETARPGERQETVEAIRELLDYLETRPELPLDIDAWDTVEWIRNLDPDALQREVNRQPTLGARVWVAYAAHRSDCRASDLVDIVFASMSRPKKPCRSVRTQLEGLCVPRMDTPGREVAYKVLDEAAHRAQDRARARRKHTCEAVDDSLAALEARRLTALGARDAA